MTVEWRERNDRRLSRGKGKTMIVAFLYLLCLTAASPATGYVLDVCATCHANATCEDKLDGSGKVCHCKYGFVGNGRTFCQDKDECLIGSNRICGPHTKCHNTFGSYYCICQSGYSPSNNMDIFIPNDGTFCQDIDECRITGLCGEGGVCRNMAGSFECLCQLGFKVENGTEPFHPGTDAASCKVVDCGRPGLEPGAMLLLSLTGTTYGHVAHFVCDRGFTWSSGLNSSVCGADGLWSKPTMVCEEVTCGPPPAPPHSHMLWNQSSRIGSEVLYRCNTGYRNIGQGNVSVCTAAGEWEEPPLLCEEILCGPPPLSESTERVWNGDMAPRSSVLYRCKKGFVKKGGQNVSVCREDGQWTRPTLSCQEILCGNPPILPLTGQVWDGGVKPGSIVFYHCKLGFYHSEGNNMSLCTVTGSWIKVNISCREISCGPPLRPPHTNPLWDGSSRPGSVVLYQCADGFYLESGNTVSVCSLTGEWDKISVKCRAECGSLPVIPNSKVVFHNRSVAIHRCKDGFHNWRGSVVSVCDGSGLWHKASLTCRAKCGSVPVIPDSEVVFHNRSVAIHRCKDGFHNWRGSDVSVCNGSGLWHNASLACRETKVPISHVSILNDSTCVRWKAETYEEGLETYKVTYTGSRDYQRSFRDTRRQLVSSKAELVTVCLHLLPATNYSVTITALSGGFTASITANTTLPVPPVPLVYYREFETPRPTLMLQRSANTLDPISSYQVFVLPVETIMVFDCSCPGCPDPSTQARSSSEYITAQIHVTQVGTRMNFTVGDGLFYGGFYNAPLEKGRNYYIILRALNQWKTASKSSCILWAKVRGTSYTLMVYSLSAAASVGLVAFAILIGYSCIWIFKRTWPPQTRGSI